MRDANEVTRRFEANYTRNVFVMMRYRDDEKYKQIEDALRSNLLRYGLTACLAKDRAFTDDLWANIAFYMRNSRYGIAVFEEMDEREYNPNISMELGFLYALERRCLLLKDKRMPRLPTDICGKIYKDFDTYRIEESIGSRIQEWCENDLGMKRRRAERERTAIEERLIHESGQDFSSWTLYSDIGGIVDRLTSEERDKDSLEVSQLRAFDEEFVGINKSIRALRGRVEFEYKVLSGDASSENVLICVIPMQETGIDRTGLIEVGANAEDDPKNPTSPYRSRYTIPGEHYGDGKWHFASFSFDFTKTEGAFYSIVAPRINEGCRHPAPGVLRVAGFRIFSHEGV